MSAEASATNTNVTLPALQVKVRGTTVTIESPRSSSSLTKSSTQQLKVGQVIISNVKHIHTPHTNTDMKYLVSVLSDTFSQF